MQSANSLLNEENRAHLTATLANMEAASANLKPALENLNATLVQVKKVLDDRNIKHLSQAAGEVGPLLADTRVLIGKMQVATDKLDVAIGDASAGGTSALMPRLNELAQDFSLTSRQLSRVLRILEDTRRRAWSSVRLRSLPGRERLASIRRESSDMRWMMALLCSLLMTGCFTCPASGGAIHRSGYLRLRAGAGFTAGGAAQDASRLRGACSALVRQHGHRLPVGLCRCGTPARVCQSALGRAARSTITAAPDAATRLVAIWAGAGTLPVAYRDCRVQPGFYSAGQQPGPSARAGGLA